MKSVLDLGYLIFMPWILHIEQGIFTEVLTKHPWGTPFYVLYVYLKSLPNLEYLIFISGKLYIEQSILSQIDRYE